MNKDKKLAMFSELSECGYDETFDVIGSLCEAANYSYVFDLEDHDKLMEVIESVCRNLILSLDEEDDLEYIEEDVYEYFTGKKLPTKNLQEVEIEVKPCEHIDNGWCLECVARRINEAL